MTVRNVIEFTWLREMRGDTESQTKGKRSRAVP